MSQKKGNFSQGHHSAPMSRYQNIVSGLSDAAFPLICLCVMGIFFIPLSSAVLDFFFLISLGFSFLIFVGVLNIMRVEELIVFPILLLLTTLLRLALNIAATRLILTKGHLGTQAAGHIIDVFGSWIMKGQFFVGFVSFIALMIINFIVITKGAGRIAEVAARFTLDGLPAKQLSIDAELAGGMINQEEANKKRKNLEEQTAFFGSMDGASKFVKGDAIAGILLMILNIVGGCLVGVFQYNLSIMQCLKTYGVLTVGDGLVAQVPSFLIAASSGILVSRPSSVKGLGMTIQEPFLNHPETFWITAVLLCFFGFIPGMPFIPCVGIGLICAAVGYFFYQQQKKNIDFGSQSLVQNNDTENTPQTTTSRSMNAQQNYPLRLLYHGIPQFMSDQDLQSKYLSEIIGRLSREFSKNFGVELPLIFIEETYDIPYASVAFMINGCVVRESKMNIKKYFVIDTKNNWRISEEALEKKDPLGTLVVKDSHFTSYRSLVDSKNINASCYEQCWKLGAFDWIYYVWFDLIEENLHDLIALPFWRQMFEGLNGHEQKTYQDMIPGQIAFATVVKIMKGLLREHIPVHNLGRILEGLQEGLLISHDYEVLIDAVRVKLAPYMWQRSKGKNNKIPVLILGHDWSKEAEVYTRHDHKTKEKRVLFPGFIIENLYTVLTQHIVNLGVQGGRIMVVCDHDIRSSLMRAMIGLNTKCYFVSHAELPPVMMMDLIEEVSWSGLMNK